ncbi:hypothetical protein BGZ61DRAFT_477204 [Ilyonectria robusta]|uniref:uncharacterized protein n=1 Tax=Ilyonectria robusta TaxID=1079257 RepID=UPI001E8D2307|nr:uncharacterized protein BGZ61DRAFT_477204 [Ilyonectria robusta]KAH8706573.1 hypothetical protein BGZ61DRAFT_477204 [Ilyonectria robusta]
MSEQTMDGKRALDHDRDTESSDAKRSRVIYVVESPGGTLRETSPSRVRRTCAEPISVDSNPPHQAVNSSIAVRSQLRDELSLLSIEEKLRKGIAMSLERERAYERAIIKGIERNPRLKFKDVQDLEGSLLTITGMQKVADLASHLDLPIHPGLLTAAGATKKDDVNEVTVDESMEIYPGRFDGVSMRKAVMGLKFQQRLIMKRSSERLQAITGISNSNAFTPFDTTFKPGRMIMPAEEPNPKKFFLGLNSPLPRLSPQEGLLAFLEHASRKNGYKKLELSSLVFKKLEQHHMQSLDDLDHPIFGANRRGLRAPSDTGDILMSLDDKIGSISLYETNLIDESTGHSGTWIWFKITKPLFSIKGKAPPQLRPMPQSWVVFAIPTLQVMKTKDE